MDKRFAALGLAIAFSAVGCYQCWLDPVGAVFSIR